MFMCKAMDLDHIVRYSELLCTSIALMSIKSSTWAPQLFFTFIYTPAPNMFQHNASHSVTHLYIWDFDRLIHDSTEPPRLKMPYWTAWLVELTSLSLHCNRTEARFSSIDSTFQELKGRSWLLECHQTKNHFKSTWICIWHSWVCKSGYICYFEWATDTNPSCPCPS